MKRIIFLSVLFMMGLSFSLSAQKSFTGNIHFKMSVEGTEDPNFLAQMTEGFDVTVFGNKTKSIVNMQGVGITNIIDGDAKLSLTVIEITGMGKYYVELPEDSINAKLKNQKFEMNYLDEYKDIAGYKAQKVEVKITDLENDDTKSSVVYVCSEFNPSETINFSTYPGLKGYPLRTETKMDYDGSEITIIAEATEIKADKKVKAIDFMRPSDAKDLMQDEELRKMFGL